MSQPPDKDQDQASWGKRLLGLLLRLIRCVALAYLLLLLAMTFVERWLVYPAPPASRAEWVPAGDDHEEVWLTSVGGVRIHGRFYDRPDAKRALLYCHGNGECVADNHELMKRLRNELDASVLIFDYRGYGLSDGKPHESGVISDGEVAQRWLAEQLDIPVDQVLLMGRSLGGGVVTQLADRQGAAALLLQSTFTRLTDAAASHYPFLPVKLLMRNRYNSLERISRYRGPVHISHGTADRVVPFSHAQILYDTSPSEDKRLFDLEPMGHNDPQPSAYYLDLRQFLENSGL